MDLDAHPTPLDAKVHPAVWPFPVASWKRMVYALFVTVLPAFSFWATEILEPEWQNGKLSSYVILWLFPKAALWFLPLLTYSIVCYLLLLSKPERFSQIFVVRAGIYTGVLLALQYSLAVFLYSVVDSGYMILLVWILPLAYPPVYRWAVARWQAQTINTLVVLLVLGIFLVSMVITREFSTPLFLILIGLVMAAPFWSFLLALRAALWLYKNHETGFTLPRQLGLTAWLAAYVAAWRFDILKMYELYNALPKTPPDCYIATAAAQGHPHFVKSHTVHRVDGISMQVNIQLQNLKCAELALMAVAPRVHAGVRKIYDEVGRSLAQRIQHPFLADAAYLLLKPFEWWALFVLKLFVPEIDSISRRMYIQ